MRLTQTNFTPHHHGFGARRHDVAVHLARALRHWLRQATDRAIGAQLTDLHCNPFLYLSPRC